MNSLHSFLSKSRGTASKSDDTALKFHSCLCSTCSYLRLLFILQVYSFKDGTGFPEGRCLSILKHNKNSPACNYAPAFIISVPSTLLEVRERACSGVCVCVFSGLEKVEEEERKAKGGGRDKQRQLKAVNTSRPWPALLNTSGINQHCISLW